MAANKVPKRPCRICGEKTQTKNSMHHACIREFVKDFGYHPFDSSLDGGRWIPDHRGIQRWIPDPPPIILAVDACAPVPELAPVPEPVAAVESGEPGDACPTCGSSGNMTCRTKNGDRSRNHKARTAPRACTCGAPLAWKRRWCDVCAHKVTRESKRQSNIRARAAA